MSEQKTMSMVERVARRIEEECHDLADYPVSPAMKETYRLAARAAIEEMREPTEEMVDAVEASWLTRMIDKAQRGAFGEDGTRKPFVWNWQTMIDVALANPLATAPDEE